MDNVYKVGGYIRDKFLNVPNNDIDYVVINSSDDEMLQAGFIRVGKDFPVYLHPITKNEYALARTERKVTKGYCGFITNTINVTLEEDLARRDLTINSIAEDCNGNLIDPFKGIEDLNNRILRHTSNAFKDDPIRVLRLARFKATYNDFTIADETIQLVPTMKEELKALQPDRVWKEVEKVLLLPNTNIFFETLLALNVLDIIFPNLYNLSTCNYTSKYHQESSVFHHTMMVLQELKHEPKLLKLVALYHDIGKPMAYKLSKGKHSGNHENLVKGLIDINIPSKLKKPMMLLIQNHTKINFLNDMRISKIINLFKSYRKDFNLLKAQLRFYEADKKGRITKLELEIIPLWVNPAFKRIIEYSPKNWINAQSTTPTAKEIQKHIVTYSRYTINTYKEILNGNK